MADQGEGIPAHNPHLAQAQAAQAAQAPQALQAPQGQQFAHLNWSNFKPEFSGKPNEDAEAHLLCMHFVDGIRVQRFSHTVR